MKEYTERCKFDFLQSILTNEKSVLQAQHLTKTVSFFTPPQHIIFFKESAIFFKMVQLKINKAFISLLSINNSKTRVEYYNLVFKFHQVQKCYELHNGRFSKLIY